MKTLANKITVFRGCLVPVFFFLAYLGYHYWAFAVFLIASISDFLDGYIARNYNQISTFGQFMDPLADKVLVIAAMCYFCEAGRFGGWAITLICMREFAVAGLRMVAAQKGIVIAAATGGKLKTIITMAGLSAMFILRYEWLDTVIMLLIVLATLFTGIDYFEKNKGVFDS